MQGFKNLLLFPEFVENFKYWGALLVFSCIVECNFFFCLRIKKICLAILLVFHCNILWSKDIWEWSRSWMRSEWTNIFKNTSFYHGTLCLWRKVRHRGSDADMISMKPCTRGQHITGDRMKWVVEILYSFTIDSSLCKIILIWSALEKLKHYF